MERKPNRQFEEATRIAIPFIDREDADLLILTVNWHNALELPNPTHRKQCEVEAREEEIRTGGVVVPNCEVVIKTGSIECFGKIQKLFKELSS